MSDLKARVLEALRTVDDPDLHRNIVDLNMVKVVDIDAIGNVAATVELTTPACPMKQRIHDDCVAAVRQVPGVGEIKITMTAQVTRGGVPEGKSAIPGVRNVIAVGSGKGGVGKTTTAVNLAIALSRMGARVGLLDADIYGPNVPGLVGLGSGLENRPRVEQGKIIPLEAHGLHVLSMGVLVAEDQPMIWRGPMLHGVVKQLLFDVAWGDKDYLVIDLPPGTGDVPLSMSQMIPITGAVVVTTPQNVALQDVRKGIMMFRQVGIPLLGIVENMSYYLCPKCGHRDEIFDNGGGRATALEMDVPFLGEVPLNGELRRCSDVGLPAAANDKLEFAAIYKGLAQAVAQRVSVLNAAAGPKPFAIIQGG